MIQINKVNDMQDYHNVMMDNERHPRTSVGSWNTSGSSVIDLYLAPMELKYHVDILLQKLSSLQLTLIALQVNKISPKIQTKNSCISFSFRMAGIWLDKSMKKER